MNGAQVLVEALAREGVEMVFGVPGFHNLPVFDALYQHPRVRHMLVRHEQAAAFMADGYARASGRSAAVLALPGPGVTYAYTGLAEAYTDSSPVLLLATQVDQMYINQERGLLHELPHQFEIVSPVMKFSARLIAVEEIDAVVHRAVAALHTGRPRPVQIEIPHDLQLAQLVAQSTAAAADPLPPGAPAPPPEVLEEAARALRGARQVICYAGGGVVCSGASTVLLRLAERLGAPVITSGMGAGSIPGDHPLACGVGWDFSADIRPLLSTADVLLAVGTRFTEAMTRNWTLQLPPVSIQIDVVAEQIGRNLPVTHALVGDAHATLTALEARLATWGVARAARPTPDMAVAVQDYRAALQARAGRSLPWMRALRASLPRDAILSADMTLFWADVLGMFPIYAPRTMLFPWGYGTLGFGIPAALGAKAALPERPVVSIVGDGAFLYTGMELATAVKYGLNVPILVFNDNAFGVIKQQQRDFYDARFVAVDLHNPDFVQLARAFGANGTRVESPEALGAAVTQALAADKPTVIEVPWHWE